MADTEWAKDIPDWLLEEIKCERLVLGLVGIVNENHYKVGDAETCAYLFTRELAAPVMIAKCFLKVFSGAG